MTKKSELGWQTDWVTIPSSLSGLWYCRYCMPKLSLPPRSPQTYSNLSKHNFYWLTGVNGETLNISFWRTRVRILLWIAMAIVFGWITECCFDFHFKDWFWLSLTLWSLFLTMLKARLIVSQIWYDMIAFQNMILIDYIECLESISLF